MIAPSEDWLVELSADAGGVSVRGPASHRVGCGASSGQGDGVSAEWNWDGHQLALRNDRFGFSPLYYCDTGDAFRLSPSIPRLVKAGAPSDLDEAAFAVFLRLGFFVGEDTPFAAIRALPPAARLTWQPGHLRVSSEPPAWGRLEIDRPAAVRTYARLFRDAIRRCVPRDGRVVLPLSGGQDSRHILFELLESGIRPVCVTARYDPPRATPDAEIAAGLTRALGLRHAVLDQPASPLETLLRHHAVTGFCTLTPSSFSLVVADFLRDAADVAFDGLAGDVMSAGLFNSLERDRLFREGRIESLAADLLAAFNGGGGFHDDMLGRALGAPALERFSRRLAIERLVRELGRHAAAPNPVASFCFLNRTRRDISLVPFRVYAGVPTVHCPYLDRELVDFLASLPAELVVSHSFHRETIDHAFPRWRSLPYAAWEDASGRRSRRRSRRLTREILRHCAGGWRCGLVRPAYAVPRLLRGLVDPGYGRAVAWFGPLLVYLRQLERLVEEGPVIREGASRRN